MRRARVLGFGLLLGSSAACSRDEVPADDSDPAAPLPATRAEPAADVVAALPVGAWVRVSQQRLLSAADVSARLDIASDEPFRIAEVVAVEGEFVKLRTLVAEPEVLCATTRGAEPNFEIHFFAEVDALQAVLREPKVVEFDDGTRLELAAGVPVDLSGPEPSVQLDGANLVVPLAKHEIGWWFLAAAPGQARDASSSSWSQSRPLHYGERSVEPHGPPFVVVRDWRALDDNNTLLTFADACGRFTLRVEGEVPSPTRSGLYSMKGPRDAIPAMARNFDPDMAARNAGILGVMARENESWGLACGPRFEAPPGVALTWQDSGNIAGVTRTKVLLPKDAHEGDGKRCFTADDLAVCIASDLLVRKESGVDCDPDAARFGLLSDDADADDPAGPRYGADRGPEVRLLNAQVSPGLDPDIVRRIVRAHIDELRSCYNTGKTKQPQLAGSVTIAFEIGAKGKVASSTVHESTLTPDDAAVPSCFAKAIKRWQFPRLTGVKSVSVTYPFELLSL